MLDIEVELVRYLSGNLDVPVAANVPESKPDSFVSLERTGGSFDSFVIDRPTVAVQCWGITKVQAKNLAYKVDELVRRMPDEVVNVTQATRNSLYNFPDEKRPRYQVVFDFVVQQ